MARRHPTDGSSALKARKGFSLADWRGWPDDERWELINGKAWNMSPAPHTQHQRLARQLITALSVLLEGKACEPFVAPVDVFLGGDHDEADTVVQPDVMVVCDPSKVHDDGIHGAPDLVVEILSDSTAGKDLGPKKALYEEADVRELWIINPVDGTVFQYVHHGQGFAPILEHKPGSTVVSAVIPGFAWIARKG